MTVTVKVACSTCAITGVIFLRPSAPRRAEWCFIHERAFALFKGHLHTRHLQQHEDSSGDDLHPARNPALQPPLPADVARPSGGSGRPSTKPRAGKRPGGEPGRPGPRAVSSRRRIRYNLDKLNAWLINKCIAYAERVRTPNVPSGRSGSLRRRSKLVAYRGRFESIPCASSFVSKNPPWCASTTTNTR